MSPSANDANRRRPGRRGDGPGTGPGPGRDFSRGRPGRNLGDPRKAPAGTFRRRAPRSEGDGGPSEPRRWSREPREREEGRGRPKPTSQEPRPWRPARREEGFSRPLRGPRRERPAPEAVPPEGEAHAGAAPSELIWGRHSAEAALESGRPIHRIWCTPEMRFRPGFLQLLREAKASGVLVEEVTWARLGQISGGAVHQGIVLQPAAADTLDLEGLIEGCRQIGESPLLVAVDGLTDPQNLGAILRSAEALGVHGLVLPQRRNAGLTGSVAKVAAGALEHLPVARVVNLNRSLETLRKEGYRVVGLDAQGSVSLAEADLEGPLVVVTGSEGQGLSLLTRRNCDQLVRIPLRGATPSLNASVATALVLYEAARRGWMHGLQGTAPPPRLVRPAVPTEPLQSPGGTAQGIQAEPGEGLVRKKAEPSAEEERQAPLGGEAQHLVAREARNLSGGDVMEGSTTEVEHHPMSQAEEPVAGSPAEEVAANAGAEPVEAPRATAPRFDSDIHL